MKLLEEKARIAELEADATLTTEQQRLRLKPRYFNFREKLSEQRPELKRMQGTLKMMKQRLTLWRQKSRMK